MIVLVPLLSVLFAQMPEAPPVPVAPLPHIAVDPEMVKHLDAWLAESAGRFNSRAVVTVTRADAVFRATKQYSGVVLVMKPCLSVVRLNDDDDKTGNNYEAIICDGKSIFEYNGQAKTISEWPLTPNPGNAIREWFAKKLNPWEWIQVNCMIGLNPMADRNRYQFTLVPGKQFISFDIEPLREEDRKEFTKVRVVLTAPGSPTPYKLLRVSVAKPNNDTEQWTFNDAQFNLQGIEPKHFAAQKIPGWTFNNEKQKPAMPDQQK